VFAHSYGGIVTLSATTHGLEAREVILLSVPAERVPVEWRNVERAVSLRIHMDLVLLAARRRQRFTENVEEHVLPRWFREHGDSHDPGIWDRYGCKALLGL
jgi:pimeloyl-ACP methyl ester carboxylesterase